jgi:hypothetical protein
MVSARDRGEHSAAPGVAGPSGSARLRRAGGPAGRARGDLGRPAGRVGPPGRAMRRARRNGERPPLRTQRFSPSFPLDGATRRRPVSDLRATWTLIGQWCHDRTVGGPTPRCRNDPRPNGGRRGNGRVGERRAPGGTEGRGDSAAIQEVATSRTHTPRDEERSRRLTARAMRA